MTELDMAALKAAGEKALICAIMDDADQCADAVGEIAAMGPAAVHAALCAWSAVSLNGFAQGQGEPCCPEDFWGIEVEDQQTGQQVSLDELRSAAARDAIRLAACYGNKDHDTIAAIVRTAWADGAVLGALMCASVRLAASMAKLLEERSRGTGN